MSEKTNSAQDFSGTFSVRSGVAITAFDPFRQPGENEARAEANRMMFNRK